MQSDSASKSEAKLKVLRQENDQLRERALLSGRQVAAMSKVLAETIHRAQANGSVTAEELLSLFEVEFFGVPGLHDLTGQFNRD